MAYLRNLLLIVGLFGSVAGPSRAHGELKKDALGRLLSAEQNKCQEIFSALRSLGAGITLPLDARTIVDSLPEGTAYYALHVSAGKLHRYLLLGKRVVRLIPRKLATLDPWLIKTRDQLEYGVLQTKPKGPRGLGDLGENLQRLHRLLWADLGPHLSGIERIWVGSAGLARFLPLHALLDAKGRFVAEHREVAYLPCAAMLRPSAAHIKRSIALVPGYGRRRTMVKGAAEELVALKSLGVPISIWGAGLKSRGQANRAEMIEALAGKNTLVHFTGHGLAQLNPPGGTELFMGYGLPSVDIAALTRDPVHASLVVLASCQGAYAARFRQRKKLWNRSNMAEALLFAGAKAVVAASWAVKNVSSAKQMMDFYGVLKTKGPVSALTHAYRRQIQRLNIPHPRFWAAYAVYGGSGRQAR